MTVTEQQTQAAREYARSSKGKGGRSGSTDDQHTDNRAAIAEQGWTEGAAYRDTGSAYGSAAALDRANFARLVGDLRSGAFGRAGDVLVLWEISRLSRDMGAGTAVVDLCAAHGYLIHITSVGRTYDPTNYDDYHHLNSGINDARKESALLSARTLRGVNSALAKGSFHGKRPFGYARDYEIIDGRSRPVNQYADDDEAPLVRELFRRVLGGPGVPPESMRQISIDWKARGITSRNGVPFSQQSLRSMLVQVLYIGKRVHRGQVTEGSWEGIIDPDVFEAVQRLIADPTRRKHTSTAIKHAYTHTLRCDVCGGPMTVHYKKSPTGDYECRDGGCVHVDKAEADLILDNAIIKALTSPGMLAALVPGGTDDGEAAAIRTELSGKRADLAEMREAPKPKKLAAVLLLADAIDALETEVKELEARAGELSRPDSPADRLADILGSDPSDYTFDLWREAPATARRAVAVILLTPAMLGMVRVIRAPKRGVSVPAGERLIWCTA